MRIIRRRGWEIAESLVTPEAAVLNRRSLMRGTAALLAAAPAVTLPRRASAEPNPKYPAGRPLTEEKYATTYNNYYEFSESKNLWQQAQALKTSPWSIEFAGLVFSAWASAPAGSCSPGHGGDDGVDTVSGRPAGSSDWARRARRRRRCNWRPARRRGPIRNIRPAAR